MVTDDAISNFHCFNTNLSPVCSDWSPDLGSVASEAASHRQKLERLRRAFLNPSVAENNEEAPPHPNSVLFHFQRSQLVHSSDLELREGSPTSFPTHSTPDAVSEPNPYPNLNDILLSDEPQYQTSRSVSEPLTIDQSSPSDESGSPHVFALRPNSVGHMDGVDEALSPVYKRRTSFSQCEESSVFAVPDEFAYPCTRISTEPHVTYATSILPDNHLPTDELVEYANNGSWPRCVELCVQDTLVTYPPPTLPSQLANPQTNQMQANNAHIVSAANWSNQRSPVTTTSVDENRSSSTVVSNSSLLRDAQSAVVGHEQDVRFVTPARDLKMHEQEQFVRTTNSPRAFAGISRHWVNSDTAECGIPPVSESTRSSRRPSAEQISNGQSQVYRNPKHTIPPQLTTGDRTAQTGSLQWGMGVNLSKMDQTLRDFNSHLSQIDCTLGRLKGFGSLSKYLDELCTSKTFPGENKPSRTIPAEKPSLGTDSASSSEEVGRSFVCYPPPESGMINSSSTLGTSLTTLSSSVWSSLSPCGPANYASSLTSSTVGGDNYCEHSPSNRAVQGVSTRPMVDSPRRTGRRELSLTARQRDQGRGRQLLPEGHSSAIAIRNSKLPVVSDQSSSGETEADSDTYSSQSHSSGAPKSTAQVSSTIRVDQISGHGSKATSYRTAQRPSESPTRRKLHLSSPELHAPPPVRNKRHQLAPSPAPELDSIQSVPSLTSAIPRSRHRPVVITPSSSSPSSGFSGERPTEAEWDQTINGLTNHLSCLLHAGQETEARRLIGQLLETAESRSRLEALIASLGGGNGTLTSLSHRTGKRASIQSLNGAAHQSSRASLLRMAESLIVLCNRRGLTVPPRSRQHSLTRTYESDLGLSNPSLNESTASWRRHFDPYTLSHRGSSSGSLLSGPPLTFVQWPSDVRVEERLPSMRPTPRPVPPSRPKSSILPTMEMLEAIDSRAVECTSSNFVSFTELVHALTAEMSDDVRILRALFIWTVFLDVRSREFDSAAPPDSLIGTLRRIRSGQLTRNDLLHKLCRFAALHGQLINGYSKGIGYRPGMPVKNNRLFASSWLAVFVAGGWRFVNADQAVRQPQDSSTAESTDSNRSQWSNRCDEFFFLTDPEQHIFVSFPEHKTWQLLNKPISIERFAHLPLLKSAFFNANLSLKKNYGDCLITTNGQVTIKLQMPQFVGISCSLENCADHSVLRGLCLVEVLDESDIVRIQVAPCQPGKYYMHVYVSPDWRQEALDRELACSFQIHCSEHNYSRLIVMGRLPDVGFLGPTPVARTLGVSMYASGRPARPFIVHTSAEPMRIPFAITPGLKLCHQLKSFDRPGHQMVDCDSYALLQMRSSKSKSALGQTGANAFYLVRMPIEGFYYLTVYATSNTDLDADHLECVYRILIDARRTPPPTAVPAFPRQTFWWVQCRLHEPLSQRLHINRSYTFRIDAPLCDSMAVVINETDWKFLANQNRDTGTWFGKVNVGEYLGSLSVYGRFWKTVGEFHPPPVTSDSEESDEAYVKLLDYVLVE
ncbi:protein KRI1 [Clonorchis sinensis]|uniref:Protein KRI1 n=1 Tax=Clonorchis sinensis TaxID=79923 RepID=G7YW92_CLOSI|nr:protein KRI1 [Clonorchis sinensis]